MNIPPRPRQHPFQRLKPLDAQQVASAVQQLASREWDPIANPGTLALSGIDLNREGIAFLRHTLRQFPTASKNLHILNLGSCQLGDSSVPILADILESAPEIREIHLQRNNLQRDCLPDLLKGLKACHKLQTLYLPLNTIGEKLANAMVDFMESSPQIQKLILQSTGLSGEGMVSILKTAEKHPALQYLSLEGNQFSDAEKEAIVELVARNRNLSVLLLPRDATGQLPAEAMQQQTSTKLISCNEEECMRVGGIVHANQARIQSLYARCLEHQNHMQDLTGPELMEIEASHYAVFRIMAHPELAKPLLSEYEHIVSKMPELPPKDGNFIDNLFAPNPESGFAPLDNPRLWGSGEAALEAARTLPLDQALLSRRTDRGSSIIDSLITAAPTKEIVETLNKRGLAIPGEAMLKQDGQASPLLRTAIAKGEPQYLFTSANWTGQKPGLFIAAVAKLPPHVRQSYAFSHRIFSAPRTATLNIRAR